MSSGKEPGSQNRGDSMDGTDRTNDHKQQEGTAERAIGGQARILHRLFSQPASGQAPVGQGSGQPPNPTLLDLEARGSLDPGSCCPLAATPKRCNAPHIILGVYGNSVSPGLPRDPLRPMEETGLPRPNLFTAPANPYGITVLLELPPHLCSHWLLLPIKV